MISVAFYLDCKNSGSVDCRHLSGGNPGIGGTEYEFALVASALAELSSSFSITVISNGSFVFPDGVNVQAVAEGHPNEIYHAAISTRCEILVLDARLDIDFFQVFKGSSVKLVAWSHLFLNYRKLCALNSLHELRHLVCVGREQLDLLRDHDIFQKATYIYNACPVPAGVAEKATGNSYRQRPLSVTYMGSLTPNKGFHILAGVWTEVLKKEPEAQLHIIGSGQLYVKNARVGPLGLAEESYEARFTSMLKSSDGKLLDSVHFHGVMGSDKWAVLSQTRVGVPNPSGVSETFGISAVEMMMAGALIVTKRCPGFMDTVDGAGELFSDVRMLGEMICSQLRKSDNDIHRTLTHIENNFGVRPVVTKWERLLTAVDENRVLEREDRLVNASYRFKWLRELNRGLRRVVPVVPPLCRVEEIGCALRGRLRCRK